VISQQPGGVGALNAIPTRIIAFRDRILQGAGSGGKADQVVSTQQEVTQCPSLLSLGIVLRSILHQGVLSSYREAYWKFLLHFSAAGCGFRQNCGWDIPYCFRDITSSVTQIIWQSTSILSCANSGLRTEQPLIPPLLTRLRLKTGSVPESVKRAESPVTTARVRRARTPSVDPPLPNCFCFSEEIL